MSEEERETISEDKDSKVQIDQKGNVYVSGSEEVVLSDFDLKNITRINKALKKEGTGK